MDYDKMIPEAKRQLHDLVLNNWLESVFTFKWFCIIAFILIFYIVFIKLLDKKRTSKILLFGCLVAVAASIYDIFGSQFVFWTYKDRVLPIVPSLFLYSLTIIPLSFMLIYQYTHTWGKFLIFNALFTCFFCLAILPLLTKLEIYEPHGWLYIYNIPPIFISACVARALTLWFVNSEQKKKETF